MKWINRTLFLTTFLCLLPMLAGLLLWDRLPSQMPIHWNAAGIVDGYGSRAMAVFGTAGFMAAMNVFLHFMLNKDPKSGNMPAVLKSISFWLLPVLSIVLSAVTYLAALGLPVRVQAVVPLVIGVMFIALGNYLPKCRQNYTMGIRTPWSLNSPENWSRTHRIGGYCFTVSGLLLMLCALPGLWWLLFPAILLAGLAPLAYSYILYKKGV